MSNTNDIDELAERFDLDPAFDTDDISEEIRDAMEHIANRTGLLGDYNDGEAVLAEGGNTILWRGRDRLLAMHNGLDDFVADHPDLILKNVGYQDREDGPTSYAEIHERSRWRRDDDE